MELSDYLDPVELDKPEEYYLNSLETINHCIQINTQNADLNDLSKFDTVLLGIPEDRNSYNKGAALAPSQVRSELYKLISPISKIKVLDLGNLKPGNTFNDTYYALRDLIYFLLCSNLNIILIGGTQELSLPVFQAFENYQEKINLVVIDSRIDCNKDALNSTSDSYLLELLLKKNKLFKFVHVGHQTYLTEKHNLDLVNKLFHDALRLGEIRNDISKIEPILRDSDFLSFDIGAIRQSDAPGNLRPTPNGFYAEESCQIARYAGTSDMLRLFGIFEVNSKLDINNHTSALAAQMIWHFLDGLEHRLIESPKQDSTNFKTFIVGHTDLDYDMTFYKSLITDRWWLEMPNISKGDSVIISCSYEDYLAASNHEVPDIWWKTFQKSS